MALVSKKRKSSIVDLRGNPLVIENRAYEASSTGRRLGQWDAPDLSPNQAATTELKLLQRRARAGIRNNPWLSRGLNASVANEIGTGIVPRSKADDKIFRDSMRQNWNDWAAYADFDRVHNAYGIQWAAARSRRESGEVFIRIIRREQKGVPLPVLFQVLESDFCPSDLNKKTNNDNEIISGIEFNTSGELVAYWMYKKHPASGLSMMNEMVRIPAEQIIHHYIPKRPGALRGEPDAVQSMVRAHLYDKYDDAELARKESRAQFSGVIRRPDYGKTDYKYDPISGLPISQDHGGIPMLELEAGTFPNLLPGEDVTLFDGDDVGNGYKDFQRHQQLGMSAGQDIPYQLQSGDYSDINDRLWRAIMNQYHREIEQIQDLFTIHQICRVMWNEVVDASVLTGKAVATDYAERRNEYLRASHTPQAWRHIHPTQDVQAMVALKDNALDSRQNIIAGQRGRDIDEVDAERAQDKKRENP